MNISPFRFDAVTHAYFYQGARVPSITQMLESTGWVDTTWYTAQAAARGTAVHALTCAFDLGALTLDTCDSPFRGYLLAHAAAMATLRPSWDQVEIPAVHPSLKFGGRPDRVGRLFRQHTILEIKSGAQEPAHAVQLALQAILVSAAHPLPASAWTRFVLYVKADGRFRLVPHVDRRDLDEATRVIARCCV